MDRAQLLQFIWSEKRGKIVDAPVSGLAITIGIGALNFCWHSLGYGLLRILESYPEQGVNWSRNWGRTKILLNPHSSFSFEFTQRGSDDEKRFPKLTTLGVVNPESFLTPQFNTGEYRILINKQIVTLEGAILQFTRMLDELIWCRYLQLKGRGAYSTLPDSEVYKLAVLDVRNRGFRIEYVDEETILKIKERDMTVPVRLYGSVGKSDVPFIIGAVVFPQATGSLGRSKNWQSVESKVDRLLGEILPDTKLHRNRVVTESTDYAVCVGFTFAKPLHAGHLMHISWAEYIRRALSSSEPLFIESNDLGLRVYNTLITLSSMYQCEIPELVKLIKTGVIPSEMITEVYRNRENTQTQLKETVYTLALENSGVFNGIAQSQVEILNRFGFQSTQLISDSECLNQWNTLISRFGEGWQWLGYQFLHYKANDTDNIQLLKKGGEITAVAARISFLIDVQSQIQKPSTLVYVDRDVSVKKAVEIANLLYDSAMLDVEGVGVGFNMKIGTGTAGTLPTLSNLESTLSKYLDGESDVSLAEILFWFLHTRYATAKSYKSTSQKRSQQQGLAFYDYKNQESFYQDIELARKELVIFGQRVQKVIGALVAYRGLSQTSGNGDTLHPKLHGLVHQATKLFGVITMEDMFPKIKPALTYDTALRKFRQRLLQLNAKEELVDDVISQAMVSGVKTNAELAAFAVLNGLAVHSEGGLFLEQIRSTVHESLYSRGYSREDTAYWANAYLNGEFCLVRKRSLYFELLQDLVEHAVEIAQFDSSYVDILLKAIHKCRAMFFLVDGGE